MFSNRYVQRKVAATDSRSCFLCYKPTCSVMVQESQADFFYACGTHLSDPGFAVLDAASQEAERKSRDKRVEIEQLRKEWEERSKSKENDKGAADTEAADAKATDAKSAERAAASDAFQDPSVGARPETPVRRVYELHKGVLNLRYNAKRRAAQERRTKALLETPGAFPKPPTHKPQ